MPNVGRKIRRYISEMKIRNGKTTYGEFWKEKKDSGVTEFYDALYDDRPLLHENFVNFVKSKDNIKTVLEVGCGSGVYPIKFKEMFANMSYTGLDFSEPSVEYCKKNSDFEFMVGDFIKMNMDRKFDLVYSHAVIDHVYDPDKFLENIVKATRKYAYVSAYRGYFPELKEHKMKWINRLACYHNSLSVNQLKKVLTENGLGKDEFTIREQVNGRHGFGKSKIETVIEINRKQGTPNTAKTP